MSARICGVPFHGCRRINHVYTLASPLRSSLPLPLQLLFLLHTCGAALGLSVLRSYCYYRNCNYYRYYHYHHHRHYYRHDYGYKPPRQQRDYYCDHRRRLPVFATTHTRQELRNMATMRELEDHAQKQDDAVGDGGIEVVDYSQWSHASLVERIAQLEIRLRDQHSQNKQQRTISAR